MSRLLRRAVAVVVQDLQAQKLAAGAIPEILSIFRARVCVLSLSSRKSCLRLDRTIALCIAAPGDDRRDMRPVPEDVDERSSRRAPGP